MQVVLGKEYRLEIERKIKKENTPWYANSSSRLHRYVVWGDLDGLLVIAKDRTKLLTNYISVVLVDIPEEAFLITQRCLTVPTRRLPRKKLCVCDSLDFYRYGCQCPNMPW
jgi:hypothetical protein